VLRTAYPHPTRHVSVPSRRPDNERSTRGSSAAGSVVNDAVITDVLAYVSPSGRSPMLGSASTTAAAPNGDCAAWEAEPTQASAI
jgi:hypothetical protein